MENDSFVWWKHGVFYQIYPRSFMDSDGDGIGDLQGIIQRLKYLVDLGVDALWISPIYPSPMADFGYDVSDHTGIHPLFGDMDTFDRLLEEAHQCGLRVVLDYVPNHTSDEHPWFIEASQSRENPRRNWYIWRDPSADGGPPNNWESHFGGSAWQRDKHTQQYYLHLFLEKQPDLNWNNPEVVTAMQDVLRFWLDKGVDGFRMDVIALIAKHPDMPDNPIVFSGAPGSMPRQEHTYDMNQPEIHNLLRGFRQIFDAYPDERVIIGETWFMDPTELARFYGGDLDELHLPFNFITLQQPWQAHAMRKAIQSYYDALPPRATPNFVFGNHDTHRLATRYGFENHRSVGMSLLTLRGVPTMYYGDELGMQNVFVPNERWQDPVMFRQSIDIEGRDPERTPMLWDRSPNAGFSPPGVQPWLPISDNYLEINVAAQRQYPLSTLNFYKKLLALRREIPALYRGDFAFIESVPQDILAFTRSAEGQKMLITINFSEQPQNMDLASQAISGEVLLSTQSPSNRLVDLSSLTLDPNEGVLIQLEV